MATKKQTGRKADTYTVKETLFVLEYIKHFDGSKSVRKAKYNTKYPGQIAADLLKKSKIQRLIAKEINKRFRKAALSADKVIDGLNNIAFANILDYMSFGPSGLILRDSSELTPAQALCISEVNQVTTTHGKNIKFKLASKEKSLELLARYFKLLQENINIDFGNDPVTEVTITVRKSSKDESKP